MASTSDLYRAVLDAMADAGCAPMKPNVIVFDERLHRYDIEGDRRGRQNGWFVLHDAVVPFGAFGSWKTGGTHGWRAGDFDALTPEQREQQRRRMTDIAVRRAAEERWRHAQARERAERLWARARPTVEARHPYLVKKQVPAIGLRQLRDLLLVPVRDGDGTLLSLEFLNPEGEKKFLKEGAVEGGYHWLGDPHGARIFLICEGYATGASLHQASELPVAVAFSRGNLFTVAKDLHRRYPDVALVIAGDDDRYTAGNPGRRDAEEAARWVGGRAIVPDFTGLEIADRPTDFNDVHVLGGLAHLQRQLHMQRVTVRADAITRLTRPKPQESTPPESNPMPFEEDAVPIMTMAVPIRRRKTPRGEGERPNLYQDVTDRIVEMIEAGTAPWQRPWDRPRDPGVPAFPVNAATGKSYHGINVLLLSADPRTTDDPRWCGYEQAQARGWQVRSGARGATIYFFKRLEVPDGEQEDGEPLFAADESSLRRTLPLLRRHTVFHASQIEGIPSLDDVYGAADRLLGPAWDAEDRLESILYCTGARFVHGGNRAYYDPTEDVIALPPRERFREDSAFFGVAFHELGHWTGHETRLNRPFARRQGSPDYAREELRAELASAFLGAELGITHDLEQHAAYLDHYLDLLRNDNREIFRAARDAQGIADLILDRHPTWQLRDGVCVARTGPLPDDEADTDPPAITELTRHAVLEAPTTTDCSPPPATGDPTARSDASAGRPLAAPYQWVFAALCEGEAVPEDSPLGRLSRCIDEALPLATAPRTADIPATGPPVRLDGHPTGTYPLP